MIKSSLKPKGRINQKISDKALKEMLALLEIYSASNLDDRWNKIEEYLKGEN